MLLKTYIAERDALNRKIAELERGEAGNALAEEEERWALHPPLPGKSASRARATRLACSVRRLEEMVAMRREGASISQIGAKFELSGERVRQILWKAGQFEAIKRPAKPRVVCPVCGVSFIPHSPRVKTCSYSCKGEQQRRRLLELDTIRGRKVVALIVAGATLQVAAEKIGVSIMTASRAASVFVGDNQRLRAFVFPGRNRKRDSTLLQPETPGLT